MGDKHGPNRLEKYLRVHDAHMQRHKDSGFVLDDGLSFNPLGRGYILLSGSVRCAGNIELEVRKVLAVRNGSGFAATVESVEYSYNAKVVGVGNIVRYDSPHKHRPEHHVHRFDVLGKRKEERIETIPGRDWPTLGEVIQELDDWYRENFQALQRC